MCTLKISISSNPAPSRGINVANHINNPFLFCAEHCFIMWICNYWLSHCLLLGIWVASSFYSCGCFCAWLRAFLHRVQVRIGWPMSRITWCLERTFSESAKWTHQVHPPEYFSDPSNSYIWSFESFLSYTVTSHFTVKLHLLKNDNGERLSNHYVPLMADSFVFLLDTVFSHNIFPPLRD